ncbi:MAG: acyltransferase [Oscillibacter sp.]|nr:acyltransferase [Oscillibacter sp.]
MNEKIKQRNGVIDILKFIFSIVIVLYHFYQATYEHFGMGSLAVEFFAIVSGVYFFSMFYRTSNENKDAYVYIKKRFLRFFPYTTLAFFITAIVRLYVSEGTTLSKLGQWAAADIWEIFLVKMGGLNNGANVLNAPAWYISAMLIVEFVVLHLLINCEQNYKRFFIPISLLIGYGWWQNYEASGPAPGMWIGFTTFGVLRIYLATCVSYYAYLISVHLKKITITKCGKTLLTIVESGCYILAFVIFMWGWSRYYNWALILLFTVGVGITHSGASYSVQMIRPNKITAYLGRLSFSIFLIQWAVLKLYGHMYSDNYIRYSHKFDFMAVLFVSAVVFLMAGDILVQAGSAGKRWLIKHCVVSSDCE